MADERVGERSYGQDYDRDRGLVIPYTQEVVNHQPSTATSYVGDAATELVPIDMGSVRKKVYDTAAILAAIEDEYSTYPSYVSFNLPPTLTALTIVYNENKGNGASTSGDPGASPPDADFVGFGSNVSGSLNPRSSAQASAAVQVDLIETLKPNIADNVPCQVYSFFMPENPTLTDVRAKLSRLAVAGQTFTITVASPGVLTSVAHGYSVNDEVVLTTTGALPTWLTPKTIIYFVKTVPTADTLTLSLTAGGSAINTTGTQSGVHSLHRAIKAWPHFKPEPLTFLCLSQETSVQQNAETSASVALSDTSGSAQFSRGHGSSESNGVATKKIQFSPTLHAAIDLATQTPTTSKTSTVTVTVVANTPLITATGTGGTTEVTAKTNAPTALSKSVTASVNPTSIAATSPTAVPTSGLYLFPFEPQLDIFQLPLVTARVIDFSYFQ